MKGDYPSAKPEDVLSRGSAVCGGYARLFKGLANRLGLQCEYVSGYSKGYGWNGTIPSNPNHAWNAVKIADSWYFLDSTWGAGHISEKKFVQEFNDFYFLCPEAVFFYDHYPKNQTWLNNLPQKVDLQSWSNLMNIEKTFINLGLFDEKFVQFENFDNFTTSESMVDIFFSQPKECNLDTAFIYHLYNENHVEVPNSVMIANEDEKVRISVIFPTQGEFKLDVYGKPANNEGTYPKLFSLNLLNTGVGSNKKYPTVYQPFHDYFLPFKYFDNLTTSESMIDISFSRLEEGNHDIKFTYHLFNENSVEVPNSVMIAEEDKKVRISVIFPKQGEFKLDVYGKPARNEGTLPKLFSLNLLNTGDGSNKKYPTVYQPFHDYFLPFDIVAG